MPGSPSMYAAKPRPARSRVTQLRTVSRCACRPIGDASGNAMDTRQFTPSPLLWRLLFATCSFGATRNVTGQEVFIDAHKCEKDTVSTELRTRLPCVVDASPYAIHACLTWPGVLTARRGKGGSRCDGHAP